MEIQKGDVEDTCTYLTGENLLFWKILEGRNFFFILTE